MFGHVSACLALREYAQRERLIRSAMDEAERG
jgi:hypothetical protein